VSSAITDKPAKKPLLSPFRYPGGKSWLRPWIRQWLSKPVDRLVECFGGGANVTLTAIWEGLATRSTLIELDPDVASVWKAILNGKAGWLSDKIEAFNPTRKNVLAEIDISVRADHTRAWKTLLRNRVSHGGILAPGAGLLRRGEDDNGIKSRWYPEALVSRIEVINKIRRKIRFIEGDGLAWLESYKRKRGSGTVAFFIDAPYSTVGERLYTYSEIDHEKLFRVAARLPGRVLMTYHDAQEIRKMAKQFNFKIRRVGMLNRQNAEKTELLVSKSFDWLKKQ
jgi:DNA adenine methylase